jgi:Icc protein
VRLIQITDCHLGARVEDVLLGINTDQSLRDVLQNIKLDGKEISAIVCTGDIANDSHPECYSRFVSIVREEFSVPLAWVPGNHDHRDVMAQGEYQSLAESRLLRVGEWQVLLVDSSVVGEVHGEVSERELSHIAKILDATPEIPTIVALHHQPIVVGSAWIDKYIIQNATELLTLLVKYAQVKLVMFGHVHQEFTGQYKHIQLFATPSTCAQFKPGCEDFTVDTLMPGYRWFDLNADGSFSTGVSRIAHKSYSVDLAAQGY